MKTLEEFDFAKCAKVSAQQIYELAKGDYIAKAEPIILIGESAENKLKPIKDPDFWEDQVQKRAYELYLARNGGMAMRSRTG